MLKKILFLISAFLGTATLMQAASSSSTASLTALEKKAAARMINNRLEYKDFRYNARCQKHWYEQRHAQATHDCQDCQTIQKKAAALRDLATQCSNQWNPQPLTSEEFATLRSVLDNTEEVTHLESGKLQNPRTIGCHEFDMMRAELPSVDSDTVCSHGKYANSCQKDECFEAQVYKRHEAIKKNISALLKTPSAQGPDATERQLLQQMTDWRGEAADRFMVKPARLLQIQTLCDRIVQQYPTQCEAQYNCAIPFYQEIYDTGLPENIAQNLDALNTALQAEYQNYLEDLGKTFDKQEKKPLSPQQKYIVEKIIQANDPTITVPESPEMTALYALSSQIPVYIHCKHHGTCPQGCISQQIHSRHTAIHKKCSFWEGHTTEMPTEEEEQLIALMLRGNDQIIIIAREVEMLTNISNVFSGIITNCYFRECTAPNCSAKNIHQRIAALDKKITFLFQEDDAEALTEEEETLVQQAIHEAQEIGSLESLKDKLLHNTNEFNNNEFHIKAVQKAYESKQAALAQQLGVQNVQEVDPLTHEEMGLIADAQERFQPKIELDQNNPDQQPSQKNEKQAQKAHQLRGLIPLIGAGITVVAGTKAYNVAHKEIMAEFNAAQKKAEKEGLPLAPAMTKWQLRKAAVKRTGHNICTKLFKKHKLFAAGLTLLIGGTLYDFGPNLFE